MHRNPKINNIGLIIVNICYLLLVTYLYFFGENNISILIEMYLFMFLPASIIGFSIIFLRNPENTFYRRIAAKIVLIIFGLISASFGGYLYIKGIYWKPIFSEGIMKSFQFILLCSVFISYAIIMLKRMIQKPEIETPDIFKQHSHNKSLKQDK